MSSSVTLFNTAQSPLAIRGLFFTSEWTETVFQSSWALPRPLAGFSRRVPEKAKGEEREEGKKEGR